MISRRSFFTVAGMGLAAAAAPSFGEAKVRVPGQNKCPFRLGMAGFTMHKRSLEETLKIMQRVDLHYLCIKDFHLPLKSTKEECDAFHAKCAEYGVTGYAVGPIYMGSENDARNAFEYAKRVGVKTVVGVPFEMRDFNGKNRRCSSRKLLETVSQLCAEFDIRYAIHNHGPDMPELVPTAKVGYDMIGDLDKRVGLCIDIGHELRFDVDPVESVRAYRDRIYDMHLKNVTDNSRKGGATPLPRGKIDLPELVRALCEINYTGVCSLEYERDYTDNEVPVAECVGYFRGLMDSVR